MIPSISIGTSNGRTLVPIAARACLPIAVPRR